MRILCLVKLDIAPFGVRRDLRSFSSRREGSGGGSEGCSKMGGRCSKVHRCSPVALVEAKKLPLHRATSHTLHWPHMGFKLSSTRTILVVCEKCLLNDEIREQTNNKFTEIKKLSLKVKNF